MTAKIFKSVASGKISAPPSKSMSHRALICGALSDNSVIRNLGTSEDIKATLDCLKALGANIDVASDTVNIGSLTPDGVNNNIVLNCNESGSTLRFMLPICMLSGKRITLTGTERLFERPLGIYEDICKNQGIEFEKSKSGVTVCGKLKSGVYSVLGNISSQFISGLLFALPLLEGDSRIEIIGDLESASYIDLTLSTLYYFGIVVDKQDNSYVIKGGQSYKSTEYTVEADCSNAAFLEALNLLDGNVTVNGLKPDTLQGDRAYIDMFKAMAAGEKQFDLTDCPDLAPVMFAMAALYGGANFTGTARLRLKESDRSLAMKQELAKFGINVIIGENNVTVESGVLNAPCEVLSGHNDHRIVMALALLCTKTGGVISGIEAVNKSYPNFFDDIKSLGIGMEINEN